MKIQPINTSANYFSNKNRIKKGQSLNSPNFQATLKICKSAKMGVKGESVKRFYNVLDKFENKIANLKDYEFVTFYLSEPTAEKFIDTKFGKEKANLNLSGLGEDVDFFYNIQSSEDEIANDLYTTLEYLLNKKEQTQESTSCSNEDDTTISDFYTYYLTRMP